MAEIEFSVLSRSCLRQQVPDQETLGREVQALVRERNAAQSIINWRFNTQDARTKLHCLYPFDSKVDRLLDTGADVTCIHDRDAGRMEIPFDQLKNSDSGTRVVGGKSEYYLEPALLTFIDDNLVRAYNLQLRIAKPPQNEEGTVEEPPVTTGDGLPSLLGRDIIRNWFIVYDPMSERINCSVTYAGITQVEQ